MSAAQLRKRVDNSETLKAIHRRSDVVAPDAIDTITRVKSRLPITLPTENLLGEQIMAQNRDLLRNGLRRAGIKEDTLEKLKIFEGFAENAGTFLVTSLDLTHRMMVYHCVKLLERAEYIEKTYLLDDTLDDEVKIQWQGAHTDIIEQVGKAYDRTLVGTQALAKLLGTDKGEDKPDRPKPGFQPLKARK